MPGIKQIIVNLCLIGLSCAYVNAQPYTWENYTNKSEITSLGYFDGDIWATSTGGVVRYDPGAGTVTAYINSDGLGSIRSSFSVYAGADDAYFGSLDGYLSRMAISEETFSTIRLQGREGEALKLIAADTTSGFLWLATDIGVVKFDRLRHGGEVKETYRTLGSFPSETDVLDLLIADSLLYAATARGLAIADNRSQFLLDPQAWSNITPGNAGLIADSLLVLEYYEGRLFVGTEEGLFVEASSTSFSILPDLENWRIIDLAANASQLYVVASSGAARKIFSVFGTDPGFVVEEFTEAELPSGVNSVISGPTLAVGTEEAGIYALNAGVFEPIGFTGPASNDLVGGGIDEFGTIYAVSSRISLSCYQDGVWSETKFDGNRGKETAIVDRDNNLWVGSFGSGVFRFAPDGEMTLFNKYNSDLLGNDDDTSLSYIVVNSIDEDYLGNLWFSTRRGDGNRGLVMFDPAESLWTYWDHADGIIADESRAVAAGAGYVALGDRDQALTFIEYGSDPFNHSDDIVASYGTSRRLPSNSVTALAVDRDNLLWVGTNLGLAYFDDDIKFFFPVALPDEISNDVRSIVTDSRNNLWVGTSSGLAFISFGRTERQAFTTDNSLLLSNDIRELFFDETSGRLLIFTGGGLSILDYNLTPQQEAATVYAYPNPFEVVEGIDRRLNFDFSLRAEVRIYNVAGELVRTIEQSRFSDGWDGTNDYGELVASGVYVFLLTGEDQSQHTGKIFVLRR